MIVGVGVFGRLPLASAASNISYDTGAGLIFTVNGTNGNLTSLKHNGTELRLRAGGRAVRVGLGVGHGDEQDVRRRNRSWSPRRTPASA